ncbi:hypothetical protein [Comamonas thiooxydans]|uniref:hypothetical protein n=1 Tax=Comamonas thiooxydans TaxID=363952 RepID=UPI00050F585D|nr:hypothetical protein [Comamonas thiooxydans]KGG83748.1 hypothetical protein P609_17705 [Comamonas thiooxydans]
MLFDTAYPPQYKPPYDSPIEDLFAKHFLRYAAAEISFEPQHPVHTLCGTFVIDFLIVDADGRRVGIECDGKEFHDLSRDEWRDGMILGGGHLDAMYRFRGQDIHYAWEDVMYFLCCMEPSVFASRAPHNLKVLSSNEVCESMQDLHREFYSFRYCHDSEGSGDFHAVARRRDLPGDQRYFWQAAYRFAVSVGGGSLDEVVQRFRNPAAAPD